MEIGLYELAISATPGQLHRGFDPPNLDDPEEADSPDEYWASVIQGRSNELLSVQFPDAAAAGEFEWRLMVDQGATLTQTVDGAGKAVLRIDARPPQTTDVTQQVIEESRFELYPVGSTKPVLALNVMALPKRTLTMGIYQLVDPNSPETQIVGLPTIPEFLEVVNDVFHQAGVEFVSAHPAGQTAVGVVEYPYDTRKMEWVALPGGVTYMPIYLPDDSTGLREPDGILNPDESLALWRQPNGSTYVPPGPGLNAQMQGKIVWLLTRKVAISYSNYLGSYTSQQMNNPPTPHAPFVRGHALMGVFADNIGTAEQLELTIAHETGHELQPQNPADRSLGPDGHEYPPYPPSIIGENPLGLTPRKPAPPWFGTHHLLKPEWAIMADGSPRNPQTGEEDRTNGELPWLHGRWMRHEEWIEKNQRAGIIAP